MTHKLQLLDMGVFGPLQNAWVKHTQECAALNKSITHEMAVEEYLKICRKYMSSKAIQSAFHCCGIWPLNPQIFKDADYTPSRMTSTHSLVPPSYPTNVPSSPSAAIMTDTDMSAPMYRGSSDMGNDGAEDDIDAGSEDGDKDEGEDGSEDGNVHTVSLVVFALCIHTKLPQQ